MIDSRRVYRRHRKAAAMAQICELSCTLMITLFLGVVAYAVGRLVF